MFQFFRPRVQSRAVPQLHLLPQSPGATGSVLPRLPAEGANTAKTTAALLGRGREAPQRAGGEQRGLGLVQQNETKRLYLLKDVNFLPEMTNPSSTGHKRSRSNGSTSETSANLGVPLSGGRPGGSFSNLHRPPSHDDYYCEYCAISVVFILLNSTSCSVMVLQSILNHVLFLTLVNN